MTTKTQTLLTAAAAAALFTASSADAALLAADDFSTYIEADLDGQGGAETGFSSAAKWSQNAGGSAAGTASVTASDTVSSDAVSKTINYARALSSTIASGADGDSANDIAWVRVIFSSPTNNGGFASFVIAESGGGNENAMRINLGVNGNASLNTAGIDFVKNGTSPNTGATNFAGLGTAGAGSHEFLVKMDFATSGNSSKAWLDPDLSTFDENVGGVAFTLPDAFDELKYVRIQTAGSNTAIEVEEFEIGRTAQDVGAVPEPGSLALLGLGGLLIARRRRG